jgi:hypothetical protein
VAPDKTVKTKKAGKIVRATELGGTVPAGGQKFADGTVWRLDAGLPPPVRHPDRGLILVRELDEHLGFGRPRGSPRNPRDAAVSERPMEPALSTGVQASRKVAESRCDHRREGKRTVRLAGGPAGVYSPTSERQKANSG